VQAELDSGALREIRVGGVEMKGPIYFVHRTDKFFSAVHRDLVGTLREQLGPPPSPDGETGSQR
jgi:hypothetical protein